MCEIFVNSYSHRSSGSRTKCDGKERNVKIEETRSKGRLNDIKRERKEKRDEKIIKDNIGRKRGGNIKVLQRPRGRKEENRINIKKM